MLRLFLVLLLLLSGCSHAKLDPSAWRDQQIDVTWPREPETPRIRLLRVIKGPEDIVTGNKGAVGRFFDFFAGNNDDYADLFTPHCIAADGNGLMYIADPSLGLIHRYDLASNDVTYIAQAGTKPLESPVGVVLDKQKNVYVTDSQTAAIYKYNEQGTLLGELDGQGKLKKPAGIAITSRGDKVVADILANKVFVFDKNDRLKKELPGADFAETLNMPTYVAVDKADRIYVTDSMNFTIRIFDAEGNYLRSQGQVGDSPGSFARPKGVALDSDDNLYVLDAIFGNFQIFNQQGQLLLYVSQEGTLPGEMMLPTGIFIDKNDRIYIADTFNHRIQVFQYLKQGVHQ